MQIDWKEQIKESNGSPLLIEGNAFTLRQLCKTSVQTVPEIAGLGYEAISAINEKVLKEEELKASELADLMKIVKASNLYALLKAKTIQILEGYDK